VPSLTCSSAAGTSPTGPEQKLLKNTVEWMDAGLCKLVVLSPTHDAHRRKLGPDEVSYFDHRVVYPNEGADYETGSDAGITVARKSIVGTFDSSTDTMYLHAPGSKDPAEVETTLVHEIQHDADDAGKGERWFQTPAVDPEYPLGGVHLVRARWPGDVPHRR
jgi:hypothetical protein